MFEALGGNCSLDLLDLPLHSKVTVLLIEEPLHKILRHL